MARTWPVTKSKMLVLAAFDVIARPLSAVLLRETPALPRDVKRILVLEIWHIGDVVLATPVLRRLRQLYPSARITLLAKPHAIELLQGSQLVDEIITFDFPWTAITGKYQPRRYVRAGLAGLITRLREERFDLTIDCRMDLRNNILTRTIRARRRVGYDFGGGGFLLSDAIPPGPSNRHKVDDWMALLEPLLLPGDPPSQSDPDTLLWVSEPEREEAAKLLRSHGVKDSDILVGIHPGGSSEIKRWPADYFAEVGRRLMADQGVRLIVFVDPIGCGSDMKLNGDALFVRTTIREMMALFTHCDFLICNDSGPMHVAAALGLPVVAVFVAGSPESYGPRGLNHMVLGSGASAGKTTIVGIDAVADAAGAQLKRLRSLYRHRPRTAR